MPPGQIIFDGLWHCTCPFTSGYLARTPFSKAARAVKILGQLSNRPSRRAYTRIHAKRLVPAQQPQCAVGQIHDRRWAHDKTFFWQALPQAQENSIARELSTRDLYEELRKLSTKGEYSRVRDLVETLVTEHGEKPNIRLYHALILANANHHHGSPAEVKRLLQEMAEEGIALDSAIYHAALRVLAVHPDYLLRQHILSSLRQRWFSLTRDGYHDLVAGLIRDRQLEFALEKLEEMQSQDVKIHTWLYDMIIHTLCTIEEFDQVLRLMHYRLASGELLISSTLWYRILDTASRALHHEATTLAYNARVETSYLNPPSGILINVLSTAARHGDTRLATSVLHTLSHRSGNPVQLHHYEALIETYIAAHDIRTALILLTTMTSAGHPPTEASTRTIYQHLLAQRHRPARALAILKELREENKIIPTTAINVIIETYVAQNSFPRAMDLYKNMQTYTTIHRPNTGTFNILLRGCHRPGWKDTAMFLASEMVALKIPPDLLTYDRLILVCLNSGGLDDAWRYFQEMRTMGWWPRAGTADFLAKRACWVGDGRVWELEGEGKGSGVLRRKLDGFVENFWMGKTRERFEDGSVDERQELGRKEEAGESSRSD